MDTRFNREISKLYGQGNLLDAIFRANTKERVGEFDISRNSSTCGKSNFYLKDYSYGHGWHCKTDKDYLVLWFKYDRKDVIVDSDLNILIDEAGVLNKKANKKAWNIFKSTYFKMSNNVKDLLRHAYYNKNWNFSVDKNKPYDEFLVNFSKFLKTEENICYLFKVLDEYMDSNNIVFNEVYRSKKDSVLIKISNHLSEINIQNEERGYEL